MTKKKDTAAAGGHWEMFRSLRAFLRDTSGNYAILGALLAPILIGASQATLVE